MKNEVNQNDFKNFLLSNSSFILADTLSDGEDIYPAVGETVNRIAYQSNFLGCRIRDFAIQIKNCDSYYVYYLLPTRGCPASYCFGML